MKQCHNAMPNRFMPLMTLNIQKRKITYGVGLSE